MQNFKHADLVRFAEMSLVSTEHFKMCDEECASGVLFLEAARLLDLWKVLNLWVSFTFSQFYNVNLLLCR